MTEPLCDKPTMPLIGDSAPEFTAETTQGPIHFPQDFKGKWVILFSHPADFTPVCTTEFMTFANMASEFADLNTELIGLSIDSLSSHLAWLQTIEERVCFGKLKNIYIQFPLIADLSADVAKKYGMIHTASNNTKAVRAVFFIDPSAKIRTILYYPSSLGRNFDEIKRILIGLQASDAFGVSMPADWQPGRPVIAGTASTLSAVQKAHKDNAKKSGVWFLSFRDLAADLIYKKLKKSTKTKKKAKKR